MTAGVNWYRIGFIFLPAIIRGELSAITLYLPFIFGKSDQKDLSFSVVLVITRTVAGYLLNRSVTQWKSIFDASNTVDVKLKTSYAEQRAWIYGYYILSFSRSEFGYPRVVFNDYRATAGPSRR